MSGSFSDNALQWDPPRGSRRVWILALLLALLLHALALEGPWARFLTLLRPAPAPRVEVQQVDPAKLDAIRRKWRESEKSLLLPKDKSRPREKVAPPPDARYQSDRNIRVEKEQRARQADVLPRPQTGGAPRAESRQPPAEEVRPAPVPPLSRLGVPFRLNKPAPKARTAPASGPGAPQSGTDQAILDDKLPEGSENLLNAQESVYYSFFARMYETIGPMWRSRISSISPRPRLEQGDYTTQVEVVMDTAGNVLDVKLLRSSGVPEFDQVVASAWRAAKQFPNPPRGLLESDGRVHTGWTFTVRMNPGFGLYYAPPERNS